MFCVRSLTADQSDMPWAHGSISASMLPQVLHFKRAIHFKFKFPIQNILKSYNISNVFGIS